MYYSIADQEYSCLQCDYCDATGVSGSTVIHLDCSNIQTNATNDGCVAATNVDGDTVTVDLCVEGDAPIPTTPSNPKEDFFTSDAVAAPSAVSSVLAVLGGLFGLFAV